MYYIGIDLGGTNIATGLVNKTGEIILKKSICIDPIKRNQTNIQSINIAIKTIKRNSI